MGFGHVQGKVAVGSGTSVSVTLTSTPTPGNIICVGIGLIAAVSGMTVKDSNNNSYAVTPNSPAGTVSVISWLAYLLSAPANATATITASWTTSSGFADIFAEEFSVTGGTQSFDVDVPATGSSNSSTALISTPSITPAAAGGLLYSVCVPFSAVNTPTTGNTQGGWTGGALDINGPSSEYILSSASGATAVSYTDSATSDPYSCMAMAFKIASSSLTAGEMVASAQQGQSQPVREKIEIIAY